MSATAKGEPGWLRQGDTPQPFVVTICTGASLQQDIEIFRSRAGELATGAEQRLADDACRIDIDCSAARAWALQLELNDCLASADVCIRPASEPRKRLLICDMDMTIVDDETLDVVAERLGYGERISAITQRAMRGEIEFDAALRERIAILAGQPEQVFHDVARELRLNPGARELIDGARAAGVHTILVTGGFAQLAEPLALELGFDEVHCNYLDLEARTLTGRVREPLINADLKRQVMLHSAKSLGLRPEECCAIGDGANDLPMLAAAGLGIAYRAKPVLRGAASCRIDATDLGSALHFMGLERP
ncbi:MAG: phosphoserine phosphatase SerB [Gammaproteobacteria bacterium]|nr:phosphoserine phosphatase SerB [Gammaproteobacteria bacterium]